MKLETESGPLELRQHQIEAFLRQTRLDIGKPYSFARVPDAGIIAEIAASPARFTIAGEFHPDATIESLISALIDTGRYGTLYLEALRRGDYQEEGDRLKHNMGVYSSNPAKYDRIIRSAVGRGMAVRGIDSKRKCTCEDTAEWADYILETSRGKCLALAGAAHVNYWRQYDEKSQSLPAHIAIKGVPAQCIDTVGFLNTDAEWALKEGQVYRLSDLPGRGIFLYMRKERIGDYVFARARTMQEILDDKQGKTIALQEDYRICNEPSEEPE